jgi:hypothetical protein
MRLGECGFPRIPFVGSGWSLCTDAQLYSHPQHLGIASWCRGGVEGHSSWNGGRFIQNPAWGFPRIHTPETVWKMLDWRDGGLRCAPWRSEDTPRICPTTSGVASVHTFPGRQDGDAPGSTAYG